MINPRNPEDRETFRQALIQHGSPDSIRFILGLIDYIVDLEEAMAVIPLFKEQVDALEKNVAVYMDEVNRLVKVNEACGEENQTLKDELSQAEAEIQRLLAENIDKTDRMNAMAARLDKVNGWS